MEDNVVGREGEHAVREAKLPLTIQARCSCGWSLSEPRFKAGAQERIDAAVRGHLFAVAAAGCSW